MKLRLIVATILVCSPLPGLAQDFALGTWGDTIQDVQRQETQRQETQRQETRSSLPSPAPTEYRLYETGDGARVVYQFNDEGRLNRGTLLFPEPELSPADADQHFRSHHSILVEQYGEPGRMQAARGETDLTDSPDRWANALQQGLVIQALWETERTRIQHQLMWHNGQPWEQTVYEPIEALTDAPVSGSAGLF